MPLDRMFSLMCCKLGFHNWWVVGAQAYCSACSRRLCGYCDEVIEFKRDTGWVLVKTGSVNDQCAGHSPVKNC
jgi:hypothetical protein